MQQFDIVCCRIVMFTPLDEENYKATLTSITVSDTTELSLKLLSRVIPVLESFKFVYIMMVSRKPVTDAVPKNTSLVIAPMCEA